jgi:pantoate kinase
MPQSRTGHQRALAPGVMAVHNVAPGLHLVAHRYAGDLLTLGADVSAYIPFPLGTGQAVPGAGSLALKPRGKGRDAGEARPL